MKKINLVILLIMSLTAALGGEAQSLSSTGRSVEQKLSQTNTQAQPAAAQETDSESVIEGFSNLYVSWLGGYENFDKGYYGIGYESFFKSGVMFTFDYRGNWGIVDPSNMEIRFGSGYGVALSKWFAISLGVSAMIDTYDVIDKIDKKGNITWDSKIGGGLIASPGIRLRLAPIVLGVRFDLGWGYTSDSYFYKGICLSAGFHI